MPIKLRVSCIVLTALALLAAGCNGKNTKPSDEQAAARTGYTCCNFHHNKERINDGNYAQLPMIPAGSPIKVIDYGRYRANVEIDGKRFRLDLDYGRAAESVEQWVAKLIVDSDPKTKLAGYPGAVRKAIQDGQVMVGMTREQVIMAVGYPMTSENPRLEAPLWRYWWSSFGEYQVVWKNNLVSNVTGHPETLALMLAPGNASAVPAVVSKPLAPQKSKKPASTKSSK